MPTAGTRPIKVTATPDSLYDTDCNKNPDSRVARIMELDNVLSSYISSMETKATDEERLKQIESTSASTSENAKRDASDMMKYAEDSGDKNLVEVAKAQTKAAQEADPNAEASELMEIISKCEMTMSELRPKLEGQLPPYSAPPESDRV